KHVFVMVCFSSLLVGINLSYAEDNKTPLIMDSKDNFTANLTQINWNDFFASFHPHNYIEKLTKNFVKGTSFNDLVLFSFGMFLYSVFIWHFYRLLARRELFSAKFGDKYIHTGKRKLEVVSIAVYVIKYVILFPLIIFAWFIVYSIFMFFLAQSISSETVFLIVSSLVVATRISAYYNEDLSKDIAKLLPFALLGIFIYNPVYFNITDILHRVKEIPLFVTQIAQFLVFAMTIEASLRVIFLVKRRFIGERKSKTSME
ncbi:MAG TPA: hypothetical protein VFW99_04725, partial [Candidatus Nitrosotalea sp.]|nr:hypothetical protein [Candidatus Nitrosotalea sp.]